MVARTRDDVAYELVPVPRGAVRLPIELPPPDGFRPDDPATWPDVEGRIEYVGGRLLYMPPCGEIQQVVVLDVSRVLGEWIRTHEGFRAGTNEAGMVLRGATRGADAAVWRRTGPPRPGFARVPPILAVEVAGSDEGEAALREKAGWYLEAGVELVWLVLPQARKVVVLAPGAERCFGDGEALAEHASLPGLAPPVAEFFVQIR